MDLGVHILQNIWTPGTHFAAKSVPYHKICSPDGSLLRINCKICSTILFSENVRSVIKVESVCHHSFSIKPLIYSPPRHCQSKMARGCIRMAWLYDHHLLSRGCHNPQIHAFLQDPTTWTLQPSAWVLRAPSAKVLGQESGSLRTVSTMLLRRSLDCACYLSLTFASYVEREV